MVEFLSEPARLRQIRDKLLSLQTEPKQAVARIEALAECNFRLAVHAETPAGEALVLLREACRLDGANPKYAYHMGRIFILHGRLDEAAQWFHLACCLSPTSHRIWAHVSLLQAELNQRYAFNDSYEPNALLKRAERIVESIGQGRDTLDRAWLDFVPPQSLAAKEHEQRQGGRANTPSPKGRYEDASSNGHSLQPAANVPRLVRPGVCRWSGAKHMRVEQLLRGRASAAALKQLVPLMEDVAADAERRPAARAAFVVLAVEWLVCGYPVTTIRRLMQSWPEPPQCLAWELLECVCELYESPLAELPTRLARSVELCRIPALLGAVIHQRRLLWRPLEFRALVAHRAARRLLGQGHAALRKDGEVQRLHADADELAQRLLRAAETLFPPAPKPLADIIAPRGAGPELAPQIAQEHFGQLVQTAANLDAAREAAFLFLKEQLLADAGKATSEEQHAQVAADRAAFQDLLAQIESLATRSAADLDGLLKQVSTLEATALGADFERRSDECGKALRECCNSTRFLKVLKRIDKLLPSPTAPAATPAARILELRDAVMAAAPQRAPQAAEPLDAADVRERLGALEQAVAELSAIRDDGFVFVKEELTVRAGEVADDAGFSQFRADRDAIDMLIVALKAAGDEGSRRLELLQVEIAHLDNQQLGGDFDARCEGCGKSFIALTTLANFLKVLRRLDKQLNSLAESLTASPCSPSPLIQQLCERAQCAGFPEANTDPSGDLSPAADTAPEKNEQEPKPHAAEHSAAPPKQSGLAGLRPAVHFLEDELERLFHEAYATFAPYPAWCRLLPPLQALQASVQAREAETLFRIGRTARARRIWSQMLRRDPGQEPVVRNLAVCDALEGDTHRSLVSWQRYLEILYQQAIFAGHPAERAAARVRFHRAMGQGHAPPFLWAKLDNEWSQNIDAPALLRFLSSPGRVGGLIDHLMLEYLNSRFEFRSPSLILGLKRVEAQQLREPAAAAMIQFVQKACQRLPDRIRAPIAALAQAAVEDAAQQCESTQRLKLSQEPNYAEQERHQLDILIRVAELRLKLVIAFQKNVDMVKHLTSIEFLTHFDRLSDIPLGQSPELLKIAANSLGMDEDALADLPKILRQNVVAGLMQFLLADHDDEAERAVRERQYMALVGKWVLLPALKDDLELIENSQPFFPEAVMKDLRADAASAIPHLRRWAKAYPAFGGISRLLAVLLIKQEEFEEAEAVIARAREHAFYEPGLLQLNVMQNQLNARRMHQYWEDEAFSKALPLACQMIELDDAAHSSMIQQCLVVIMESSPRLREDPGHERIGQLIDAWLHRAAARREEQPARPEDYPTVSDQDLTMIEEMRGLAQARMILGPLGDLQSADGDRVVALMNDLLQQKPGMVGAHFCRAIGWLNKANKAAAEGSGHSQKSSLDQLVKDAKVVEERSVDESLRKQAQHLRQLVEKPP